MFCQLDIYIHVSLGYFIYNLTSQIAINLLTKKHCKYDIKEF